MKKLNQESTKIFLNLIDKLGEEISVQINASNNAPLCIELVSDEIFTPMDRGKLYSISHVIQNNHKSIRDPEMCFIVVDNRKDARDFQNIAIYPQLYKQDTSEIWEESVEIEQGIVKNCKPLWQAGHHIFATQWLKAIKETGYINNKVSQTVKQLS